MEKERRKLKLSGSGPSLGEAWHVIGRAESSEDAMSSEQKTQQEHGQTTETASKSRRAALAKLGLGVGAAYLAPTVLRIDRSAQAMGPSCVKNPKFCT